MKRILLGTLTIWALFLAPTLCFGGVVEHACTDCDTVSCSHELDCAEDPCNEPAFRSDDQAVHSALTGMAVVESGFLAPSMTTPVPCALASFRPPAPTVCYESDLPLLI